jgi:beta-barrel assembly-enhancing protease
VDRTVFKGQWSSGEKANAVPVTVVFEAGGISFGSLQEGQRGYWNYSDLLAGAPVLRNAGDVLLRNRQVPLASLFIEGEGAASLVLARAPHTSERSHRLKILGYSLIATAVAAVAGVLLFFGGGSASKAIAALIPPEIASSIGLHNVEMFGPIAPACVDQPGNAALQRMLDRLQGATGNGRPFTLHVAKASIPNAFALPGGHIVLLSALVKQAESPEEAAGVLAHEMGHGIEMDPEALFVRNLGMQTLISLMTGQSGNGTALEAGAFLLQLRYSREAERAADDHAVEILRKAGVASKPTGDFFLRHASDADGGMLSYLSTHPDSKDRAKLFHSQQPYAVRPLLTGKEWADAKALCGDDPAKDAKPRPAAKKGT